MYPNSTRPRSERAGSKWSVCPSAAARGDGARSGHEKARLRVRTCSRKKRFKPERKIDDELRIRHPLSAYVRTYCARVQIMR